MGGIIVIMLRNKRKFTSTLLSLDKEEDLRKSLTPIHEEAKGL